MASRRFPWTGAVAFPMCYGLEFIAKAVQDWIGAVGAKTAYITPGSPWENGFIESWRRHYNMVRPHASIGDRAPAPEVFVPALAA